MQTNNGYPQKTSSIEFVALFFQIQHIVSRLGITTIILVLVPQRASILELSLTYFITFI